MSGIFTLRLFINNLLLEKQSKIFWYANCFDYSECYKKTRLNMDKTKQLVAVFILLLSGQAMAQFMPEGVHSITDRAAVTNEVGC